MPRTGPRVEWSVHDLTLVLRNVLAAVGPPVRYVVVSLAAGGGEGMGRDQESRAQDTGGEDLSPRHSLPPADFGCET